MSHLKKGEVSLERAFSKLGLASRTAARALIVAGEISVDGRIVRDPQFPVRPERVRLARGGTELTAPPSKTLLFHKPRGLVTTRADEKGRPTVFSAHPESFAGLHAVGRLDMATSGLLILTNSTRLSAWLTDPSNRVLRVYVVTVEGRVEAEKVGLLLTGVEDQGELLRAEKVELRKASGRESHLVVTLAEGKNRELRRLFERLGHPVTKIKRVAFGGLTLGELPPGEFRTLSPQEIRLAFPGAP